MGTKVTRAAVLLSVTAVVAACGFGTAAPPSGNNDAQQGTTSSPGAPLSGELTFWIHGADPFIKAHKSIAAAFEKANPGVTVNVQSFPFADFNTRIVASLPSGRGPDVMEAYSPWMNGYVRTGLLAPVPESIGTSQQIEDRYYKSTLSLLKYKEKYYGLPANLAAGSTRVLLVNNDAVSKAGVDLDDNKSFGDWVADWKSLTVANGGRITKAGLGQSCGQPADQFVSYLLEYGGSLYTDDGKASAFDDDAGRQALKVLTDLVRTDKVDSTDITDFTCIPQGTAATGYRGTWVIPEYLRDFPKFNWSYKLMPLPPGATQDLWQGGSGWATFVPASSTNRDLAWAFVKFIEDNRAAWIKSTGEIPAQRDLAAAVAKENPKLYGVYYPILDQSVHGYPYGDYFFIYQTLSDMVTSTTLGQASVDDALAAAKQKIDAHLNQWWQQYP